MSLSATAVSYSTGKHRLVDAVTLKVEPGKVHALLGPNGAGKSTLLRLLCGDCDPTTGSVALNGRPLKNWSPGDRARQRSVLPQSETLSFAFTASQVVELGRLPCHRHHPAREQAIAAEALAVAGVSHLAERQYPTLSGGERARVQLARVLAQIWEPVAEGPRYLLLDEPTASLDLAHQHDVLEAICAFAGRGVGVLTILHDVNLAARYADRITMLKNGRILAQGAAETTLTAANIGSLYGVEVELIRPLGGNSPVFAVRKPADRAQSAA